MMARAASDSALAILKPQKIGEKLLATFKGKTLPGVWLYNGSTELCIYGQDQIHLDTPKTEEIFWMHNRDGAVIVRQPTKKLSGTVTGQLVGYTTLEPTTSVSTQLNKWRALTASPDTCSLAWGTHDIPVSLHTVGEPVEWVTEETIYDISFGFVQR